MEETKCPKCSAAVFEAKRTNNEGQPEELLLEMSVGPFVNVITDVSGAVAIQDAPHARLVHTCEASTSRSRRRRKAEPKAADAEE